MADLTFKCPSCGGYLTFDPASGQWKCPYCGSMFRESEVKQQDSASQKSAEKEAGEALVYHCPSCGSEIVTDATTIATHCYYCHNPVVLQGKMTDDMRPQKVLPFALTKDQAVERFLEWVRKKRYVPKGFFSKEEVSKAMKGVYFPYFVYQCEAYGETVGEAKNIRTYTHGDYIDTDTDHYHVERKGQMRFRNIMRPALSGIQRKVTDGIQPFPLTELKPFNGAFLSGFMAERRDLDSDSYRTELTDEIASYVEPMMTEGDHYTKTDLHSTAQLEKMASEYVLVPAWVMTYPDKKNPKEPYYYAMNGRTGEVCGKLPIVLSKLYFFSGMIALGVLAVCLLIAYFLIH